MEDRELLELAAKAAGIDYCTKPNVPQYEYMLTLESQERFWNPLADDGDAQRLAVKLGMTVEVMRPRDRMELGRTIVGKVCNLHNDDQYSATRRAIVRAAAEIGRSMPD